MTLEGDPHELGRVLITCGTLTNGGVQRSLVNLLKLLEPHVEEGTLLLPSLSGSLLGEVPTSFRVLTLPNAHRALHEVWAHPAFWRMFVRHPFDAVAATLRAVGNAVTSRSGGSSLFHRSFREDFMSRVLPSLPELFAHETFDIAIQYAGGQGIWDALVTERVHATRKLCWIHGDIERFGTGSDLQRERLAAYDRIVAVSEHGRDSLCRVVPEVAERVSVVENSMDIASIRAGAESALESENVEFDRFTFFSATRLTPGKALDIGLHAAFLLKDRGHDFQWLIAGGGAEEADLRRLSSILGLDDVVRFLGVIQNPYALMGRCDVFLHTSMSEGKSVAVAEAMVLGKPILVTRYPSVEDQIQNGVTGVIADLDPASLAAGMESMMVDATLREGIECALASTNFETDTLNSVLQLLSSL